jgi:hypothetical protein
MSMPEQQLNQPPPRPEEVLPSEPPAPSPEAGLSREVQGYQQELPELLELLQAGAGAPEVRAYLDEVAQAWGLSPVKLYSLALKRLPQSAPLPPHPREVFPEFLVSQQQVQEPQPQPELPPQPQPLREVSPQRPQQPLRPLPLPRPPPPPQPP